MQIKIHPNLNEITLDSLKTLKLTELDNKCNQAILENFKATLDGASYSFSNDIFAQSNFSAAKLAFISGETDVVTWTAYDIDGKLVRIQLNKEKFDTVFTARLQHVQDNISKLRDVLQPNVQNATTEEQLNSIQW